MKKFSLFCLGQTAPVRLEQKITCFALWSTLGKPQSAHRQLMGNPQFCVNFRLNFDTVKLRSPEMESLWEIQSPVSCSEGATAAEDNDNFKKES
jgi:hypothetical protein